MIDVVATDAGLYAVGGVPEADAAGIWHRPRRELEPHRWRVPRRFHVGDRRGRPRPRGGGLAAQSRAGPRGLDLDRRVEWTLAPDPEGFAGHEATDVAALADGTLAMVGSPVTGGPGRAWVSSDSVDWQLAEAEDMEDAAARTLTAIDGGIIAVGGGEDMAGRAWFSTDGHAWSPIGEPQAEAYFQSRAPDRCGPARGRSHADGTFETGIEAHAQIWSVTFDD